jgi:hypothetical protein
MVSGLRLARRRDMVSCPPEKMRSTWDMFGVRSVSDQDIIRYVRDVLSGLSWSILIILQLQYLYLCFIQNLQQSRGFGNNFKFPEGEGGHEAPAVTSNAGFSDGFHILTPRRRLTCHR